MRTAAEIAAEMNQIAPRRAQQNSLKGAKKLAYMKLQKEYDALGTMSGGPESEAAKHNAALMQRQIDAFVANGMQ